MKKPRNPHHDVPGIQCMCKPCRIYHEYIKNEKEKDTTQKTKRASLGTL